MNLKKMNRIFLEYACGPNTGDMKYATEHFILHDFIVYMMSSHGRHVSMTVKSMDVK